MITCCSHEFTIYTEGIALVGQEEVLNSLAVLFLVLELLFNMRSLTGVLLSLPKEKQ